MARCPFLSFKADTFSVPRCDFVGEVRNQSAARIGAWDGLTWPVSLMDWSSSVNGAIPILQYMDSCDITVNYKTGSATPAEGTFDDTGFFECMKTKCQLWDSINTRCGARTSDFLLQGDGTTEVAAIVNILRGIMGWYDQRDNSVDANDDTFMQSFQKMFGKKENRDNTVDPHMVWSQNMQGKSTERDSGASQPTYLQNMIGKASERDNTSDAIADSATILFQKMFGKKEDRDNLLPAIKYLWQFFGKTSERELDFVPPDGDGLPLSAYRFLTKLLGSMSEKDADSAHVIGSVIKTLTHYHNVHYHELLDPEHNHPVMGAMLPSLNLVAEFMDGTDLDGGIGPGDSLYGKDFMIEEDDNCPESLVAIHQHPNWNSPATSMTWDAYMLLLKP